MGEARYECRISMGESSLKTTTWKTDWNDLVFDVSNGEPSGTTTTTTITTTRKLKVIDFNDTHFMLCTQ